VLVVDLSAPGPEADLATLRAELGAYDPDLRRRPALVVGTKTDLAPDADPASLLGAGAIGVSAVTGDGLERLRASLSDLASRAASAGEDRQPLVVLRPARAPFTVAREGDGFRVIGRGVERLVAEADLDDPKVLARLQRRLVREGVERELAVAGARRGDDVFIGERTFEFLPEEDVPDGSA
jgi:GTP-binding protein